MPINEGAAMKLHLNKVLVFLLSCIFCMSAVSMANTDIDKVFATTSAKLSSLHDSGYGFLDRVHNNTKYPCDIYFVKDRPEDFLSEKTVIRIKSIAEGKYYSYRAQDDKTFSCKADTADSKDQNTLFTVRKGVYQDLTQRISLSPASDPTVFLTYDPDSRLLQFKAIDFASDDNKQCHWSIESAYLNTPEKLNKVYLKNVAADGCLWNYHGKAPFKLEPDTIKEIKQDSVWALSADSTIYTYSRVSGLWTDACPQKTTLKFVQLSVKDDAAMWAITKNGALFNWDGKSWSEEKLGIAHIHVAIADDGSIFSVGADNILQTKMSKGWRRIIPTKKWLKVSSRNKSEQWGIDAGDKQIYKITDQATFTAQPLPGGAIDISVACNGAVWAINATNQVFYFDGSNWNLVPGVKLKQLSVIDKNEVWGIGTDDLPYRWDGKALNKESSIKCSYIFVPSETKKVTIPGRTEERDLEGASVVSPDGKPQGMSDTAALGIEIETIGFGGSVASMGAYDYVAIPFKKRPKISGFAQAEFTDFSAGSVLNLTPLLSKGMGWLETTLPVPGKATISFLAVTGDDGGVEVVFGQEMTTNFAWKIIIGGWKNTKSGIIKRSIVNNEPEETLVAQLLPQEDPTNQMLSANPLARALPGQVIPYWVSIDNGLILVGTGNPGDNVFLTWRDPNPPANVNCVGFASDTQPVQYANIQMQAPIVVTKPARTYVSVQEIITPQKTIAWSKYLFRSNDRAAVSFDLVGKEQVALVFGMNENPASGNYYQVVFGYGDNEGIAIQKWIASEKRLKTISSISKTSYPGIALDPNKPTSFWISYDFGQIMVGQGAIGENLILCAKDIAALQNIRTLGFACLSGQSATISNMKIYPALSLSLSNENKGQKVQSTQPFSGKLMIIFPFEYEFSQVGQSVKMEDQVNHQTFYAAATPQQGALYHFLLVLDAAGTPQLTLYGAAVNESQKEVKASLDAMQAAINMQKKYAEDLMKKGAVEKKNAQAEAGKEGTEAKHLIEAANMINETARMAGGLGMMVTGGNDLAQLAVIVVQSTVALGGLGLAIPAQAALEKAASKELEGAEAQIALDTKALAATSKAEQLAAQAKLLAGQAQFDFRSNDSYVYIDKANRDALGSVTVPQDAVDNRDYIKSLFPLPIPTSRNFNQYISTIEAIILRITHIAVVADPAIRKNIYAAITTMFTAYTTILYKDSATRPFAVNTQIINILLKAYNNTFLINQTNDEEASIKKKWYSYISQLASSNIAQPNIDIDLEPMFGEYIWHPQPITNNKVTLTFQAKANGDIFVCFSPVNQAVRNTDTELYEIDLGGWDDTKSVIRLKSLGHSVQEASIDDLLNALDYQSYWISFDNGQVSVGKGDNTNDKKSVFLSWTDPYPNLNNTMKYIGFSCWNSAITIKNINISGPDGVLKSIVAPSAPQPVPDPNAQAEVNAVSQQILPDVITEVPAQIMVPVKKTTEKKSSTSPKKVVQKTKKRTPPKKPKIKVVNIKPKPKKKISSNSSMPVA